MHLAPCLPPERKLFPDNASIRRLSQIQFFVLVVACGPPSCVHLVTGWYGISTHDARTAQVGGARGTTNFPSVFVVKDLGRTASHGCVYKESIKIRHVPTMRCWSSEKMHETASSIGGPCRLVGEVVMLAGKLGGETQRSP